jgi:hypothetical protein
MTKKRYTMKKQKFFDDRGNWTGKLPKQCIMDCSHAGDCSNDADYWVQQLDFTAPLDIAKKYLLSTGGWDQVDLDNMQPDQVNRIVLWLACNDIKESGEFYGLTE